MELYSYALVVPQHLHPPGAIEYLCPLAASRIPHNLPQPAHPRPAPRIPQLHDAPTHLPPALRAADGIVQRSRNARAEPSRSAIPTDGFRIAETSQALLAAEAAVAAALHAAEGEGDGVVDGEVVDGDHTRVHGGGDGVEVARGGAEDGGAEGVRGGVCEGDGVGEGGGAHDDADWGEGFLLRDAHAGRYVYEEGGGEVVPLWVGRVGVALAAY